MAIAEARIKTDKISGDILCDLLRSNLLPEPYALNKETRDAKNILRQRMFFVRVQTMTGTPRYFPRLPMSLIYLELQGWNG